MPGTTQETGPMFPTALADGTAVKLIGLGGVGSIAARYLAVFLRSLQRPLRLVLVDGDAFEPANASRMLFSGQRNKAAVIRDELTPQLADTPLTLVAVPEFVTARNLHRLVREQDVVLLAVDNHATRKLVSDHCSNLADVVLISGGNDGVGKDAGGRWTRGTYGNCQAFIRSGGHTVGAPLTRFHPEIETPADKTPDQLGCAELARSVPQILFANLAAASALLSTFWLHCAGALGYTEVAFDIADGLMRPCIPLDVATVRRAAPSR